MRFSGNNITMIETIVTHKGDWLFNSSGSLSFALTENWGTIPVQCSQWAGESKIKAKPRLA
jgi:hypothetical protein